MFSRSKKDEVNIFVPLEEPLTSDSCVKLIIELVKYILYQKQQIPFTCDSLTQLHAKIKPNDRNCSSIKAVLDSLNNVSQHLSSQFLLEGCNVKEVMIIVGATIISPKLYITLELPPSILSSQKHFEYKHPSRKPLLNLMRSMMECMEFQEAMALPLNPTNTFVLLQKSDYNVASEFFVPKPQYIMPTQVLNCFRIKLHDRHEFKTECNCANVVNVYHDISVKESTNSHAFQFKQKIVQPPYQWYQSKEVIKGFKLLR